MKTVIGLVLIDAQHAALNNAGTDKSATENINKTKMICHNGRFPYVSGQAFKLWFRTALEREKDWQFSPIVRESKIAYTDADPLKYPDDDVFGYMRAPKGDANNARTRKAPFCVSTLIATAPSTINNDFSSMSRHHGDPVPYQQESYSCVLRGLIAIDLQSFGRFSVLPRAGYRNLSDEQVNEYKEAGCEEKEEKCFGQTFKVIELPRETREKRLTDLLEVVPHLTGGAKQATLYNPVAPRLAMFAVVNGGNHLFTTTTSGYGLDINILQKVVGEYKSVFLSKVFIGKFPGFAPQIDLFGLESPFEVGTISKTMSSFAQIAKTHL